MTGSAEINERKMKPINLNHTIVNIVYYTQPLCPVSWRMQQHWDEFTTKFSELINVRFCLVTSDTMSRSPEGSGREPSNIRACQAVKAVSLQSQRAANLYMNALRNAALTDGNGGVDDQVLDLSSVNRHQLFADLLVMVAHDEL